MKRTSLLQEVIRIVRNCHPDLPWVHLNALTERMRDSVYPERMRAEIIESGLNGYNKMRETDRNGGRRSVNRLRAFDKWGRRKERTKKRLNWHKK